MSLPRSILAPTDFGDTAERAVDYAFALAHVLEAVLRPAETEEGEHE